MAVYAIGVDVGGTKIAAGLVARDGGTIACHRTHAHSEREPAYVIAAIEEACQVVLECSQVDRRDVIGAGVGFAGTIDGPSGSILISSNLPPGTTFRCATSWPSACGCRSSWTTMRTCARWENTATVPAVACAIYAMSDSAPASGWG